MAGLLAIALTADHVADDAVRLGAIAPLAQYLRRSVTGSRRAAAAAMRDRESLGGNCRRSAFATGTDVVNPAADAACSSESYRVAEVPLIQAGRQIAVCIAVCDVDDNDAQQRAELGVEEPDGPTESEQDTEMLRSRREMYALQGVACLGEYLESVTPLMQARPAPARRHTATGPYNKRA